MQPTPLVKSVSALATGFASFLVYSAVRGASVGFGLTTGAAGLTAAGLAGCAVSVVVLVIAYAASRFAEARRVGAILCATCGYPKPSAGSVCPECGGAAWRNDRQRTAARLDVLALYCIVGVLAGSLLAESEALIDEAVFVRQAHDSAKQGYFQRSRWFPGDSRVLYWHEEQGVEVSK
jgi:hypothetical protein